MSEETAIWLDRIRLSLPWILHARLTDVERDIANLQLAVADLQNHVIALEDQVTAAESALWEQINNLVGVIQAEFASLKSQLDAALQDKAAAVEAALGDDAAADAERLSGLLDRLQAAIPGQTPVVEEPAPGEPAEVPGELPPEEGGGEGGSGDPQVEHH
jgi:hypothetical protein